MNKNIANFLELFPEQILMIVDSNGEIKALSDSAKEAFGNISTSGSVSNLLNQNFEEIIYNLKGANNYSSTIRIKSFEGLELGEHKVSLTNLKLQEEELFLLKYVPQGFSEKTLHNQRLQTLGMLAGAIAHDFNNVLAGILGHVNYLENVLPKDQGNHLESLEAMEEGGKRASQLIQEILSFSRLDLSQQNKTFNLTSLVKSTSKLLRGALVPKYNFEIKTPESSIPIDGVEGKIAQVLVNLVINAKNACKAGGTVTVELFEPTELGVSEISHDGGSTKVNQKFAKLKIKDNGCGMNKEVLSRIFQPYFTTRASGTGYGLKIVDSIIASHGGSLEITSEEGTGSEVFVFLPITANNSQAKNVESKQEQNEKINLSGVEKVLVIDDEESVRKVIKLSLQHFGYKVEISESAIQAIDLFKAAASSSDPYKLVILDMLMPDIPGKEVFAILREISENIPVLLVSGYVSEKVVKSLIKEGNAAFLAKPFTVDDLTENIRKLLNK